MKNLKHTPAIFIAATLLGFLCIYKQYEYLTEKYDKNYLENYQFYKHRLILEGAEAYPWQTRVLSTYLFEWWRLGIKRLFDSASYKVIFFSFRFAQYFLIFICAAFYWHFLGLKSINIHFLGLSILAWGMTHAMYLSEIQFNIYTEVILYLSAGILFLRGGPLWALLPLALFSSLNRETSLLIPLIFVIWGLYEERNAKDKKKIIYTGTAALVVWGLTFVALRLYYGQKPLIVPADEKRTLYPGFDLLLWNITQYKTYFQLLATLGLIPLISIATLRKHPQKLRFLFWTIVPLWIVNHFCGSVVSETRLFLVPFAVVFIPGALYGLLSENNEITEKLECSSKTKSHEENKL